MKKTSYSLASILLIVVLVVIVWKVYSKKPINTFVQTYTDRFGTMDFGKNTYYDVPAGSRSVKMTNQCKDCRYQYPSSNSFFGCICNNKPKPGGYSVTRTCNKRYIGLIKGGRFACFDNPYINTSNWDKNGAIYSVEKKLREGAFEI
jgi:hypothetical protein